MVKKGLRSVFKLVLFCLLFNQGIEMNAQETTPTGKKYTISGYIIDSKSSETLIGANVFDTKTKLGASTNEFGFFSLTLPEGDVQLSFTYVGYMPESQDFNLSKNTEVKIKLKENLELQEVVVLGDRSETGINATQMGAIDVPMAIIKSTPALLGEADLMKTIQLLPGVQAGAEGSAGVYVRGGGPDENLILLDGVPIYNVDHLFGFFSVFTPESVKKVSLFKSSFPARFGGRLSSVIDVRTNDGDMHKYHGTIGIGLLSSKLQLEGPIVKGKTAFNVSGRRSYIDLLTKPFMPDDTNFGYYFYDLNAKVNHVLNDKNRLFLSVYNGKDKMEVEFSEEDDRSKDINKSNLSWGNFNTVLRWNNVLNPKLFSNTTVAYTEYNFFAGNDMYSKNKYSGDESKYEAEYNSGIRDITFNSDFDYSLSSKHQIKFGAGYLNHSFRPEILTSRIKEKDDGVTQDTTFNSLSDSRILAHEASVYVEDNFDVTRKLSVNFGVHASMFNVQGKSYFSFQPRLSTRYKLTDHWSAKASYSKMTQYIHLLSSYTITLPLDIWVPATKNITPMQAHQYSTGGYYTGFVGWEFSLEGYYKDMQNILEYKDGASFFGSSSNWEQKVEMGTGRAFGLEFMAQRTIGKTTGWLAYTVAKSDRQFAKNGINNGERFPYKYDRRHHISVSLNHKFSEKIDVGATWEFYSGGTTTIAEEYTLIAEPEMNNLNNPGGGYNPFTEETGYISGRNNYRLPASHKLNIGANFKRGRSIWNVSVHNVYNAMNPTFVYKSSDYDYNPLGLENKTVKLKKLSILPIIPSFSYTYKF